MTQQPTLDFESAVPFQAGSHTSHKSASWLAAKGDRPLKVRRLLEAYVQAGARGLNDGEASAVTLFPRSSVCSLRNHLFVCGFIERAGERVGSYGISQAVYVATNAGKAAL